MVIGTVRPVKIEDEIRDSCLDFAMIKTGRLRTAYPKTPSVSPGCLEQTNPCLYSAVFYREGLYET